MFIKSKNASQKFDYITLFSNLALTTPVNECPVKSIPWKFPLDSFCRKCGLKRKHPLLFWDGQFAVVQECCRPWNAWRRHWKARRGLVSSWLQFQNDWASGNLGDWDWRILLSKRRLCKVWYQPYSAHWDFFFERPFNTALPQYWSRDNEALHPRKFPIAPEGTIRYLKW